MSHQNRIAAMTPARIEQIRKSRRMTQAGFAEAVGWSPRTQFTLEDGGRPVTLPECVFLEQVEAGLELEPAPAA